MTIRSVERGISLVASVRTVVKILGLSLELDL